MGPGGCLGSLWAWQPGSENQVASEVGEWPALHGPFHEGPPRSGEGRVSTSQWSRGGFWGS